jgi:hypothetical protein
MRNWRNESGQVLVMAALSMTVLVGFVGFATDVGFLLSEKRMAQSLADAAAVAGAAESLKEGTPSTVTSGMWTIVSHDEIMNGYTPGSATTGSSSVTASNSNGSLTMNVGSSITVPSYASPGYVQSIVTVNAPTVFMATFAALFGTSHPGAPSRSSVGVTASAIASNAIASNGCIYVQNDGDYASPAVDMGGNSLITATTCGMTVNGDLTMGGNGTIDALFVAVSGTFSGQNSGTNWSQHVPPQGDPISKLQDTPNQPTPGTTAGGPCGSTPSGTACVYDYGCSGGSCTLSGVTLNPTTPTVYYFDEPVNVSGQVTMTNATIYLAGNNYFDFDSNGNGTFTPPGYGTSCVGSSNPYCGVLIDAPTDGSSNGGTYSCSSGKGNNGQNPGEMYFDFGSSSTDVEGIVYAPYMQLFGQDKGATTTFATDLVVGNICMQSATFDVGGYSGGQSPLTRVGLVY